MEQDATVDLILNPGSAVTTEQFRTVLLADRTVSALIAACRESSARTIGVGALSGSIDAAAVNAAERQVDAGTADVVLLPLNGYEWLELLSNVPSPILARVRHVPEGALTVLHRERLSEVVSTLDPQLRLRRVLAHLADSGCRIGIVTQSSDQSTAGPLVPFMPPALVPDHGGRSGSDLEQRLEFDARCVATPQSREDLTALQAGLFQLHDALERSHTLAQSVEGLGRHRAGDYWHAIMHRREPDYGNSKYWFRHVGRHPIHGELASRSESILAAVNGDEVTRWRSRVGSPGRWDSMAFVDLCELAGNNENGALGQAARRIQWVEMLLLLRSTCEDAFGTWTAGA